ncbi:MAG: FAD-binding oxidoreductase, partial [Minisyncoccia bacterium]
DLRGIVEGEVDDSAATLNTMSRDASLFTIKPEVVVSPKDADDICKLVEFASAKAKAGEHISLTARSAGTDMSGGPLNDSVILSMTKHFTHIGDVSDGDITVDPGVYYRDFDKVTQKAGWELPSYTASRELNTVGGMVANDSGGEKNLNYGKTDRYVEELDVVLSDGKVHMLRKLEGDEFTAKINEQTAEGELYRQMSKLVSVNKSVIDAARPRVSKNSSGYHLWDIGDGIRSLNLARLMVGSQGTLGLITKIHFSLVKPQKYSAMVVMMLKDLNELATIVPEVLKLKPDSFESYDDNTFKLAVKYFPEFAAQMGTGIIGLGISFLPELMMTIFGGVPKLVLLAEFRDDTQEAAVKRAETCTKEMKEKHKHIRVRLAPSEAQSRKYWVIRRESFNLLRKKIRGMRTAPFIDDFVVPPSVLPEFLPKIQEILSKYKLIETIAGHVGDGNFHIIPLIDPKKSGNVEMIDELSHKVYDLVLQYHGSITGEHNDGLVRTPYVEKMFGPEMYGLFEQVKRIFDPLDIFNPHKKVGLTYQEAQRYLDLPDVQGR